jgi:hypothetical protein
MSGDRSATWSLPGQRRGVVRDQHLAGLGRLLFPTADNDKVVGLVIAAIWTAIVCYIV